MVLVATLAFRCGGFWLVPFSPLFCFVLFSKEGRIKSFSGFLLLDVKDNSVLLVEDLTEVCVSVVFDSHVRWP